MALMQNTPEVINIIQQYLVRENAIQLEDRITNNNLNQFVVHNSLGPIIDIIPNGRKRDFHFVLYAQTTYQLPPIKGAKGRIEVKGHHYFVTLESGGSGIARIIPRFDPETNVIAEIPYVGRPELLLENRLIYPCSSDFKEKIETHNLQQ